MEHYFGVEAILSRLGYSTTSHATLYRLIANEGLPCFKRVVRVRGRGKVPKLYSNEALISGWELRKAQEYFQAKHGQKPMPKYLQNASDSRPDVNVRDSKGKNGFRPPVYRD